MDQKPDNSQEDELIKKVQEHIKKLDNECKDIPSAKEHEKITKDKIPVNPCLNPEPKQKIRQSKSQRNILFYVISAVFILLCVYFFSIVSYPYENIRHNTVQNATIVEHKDTIFQITNIEERGNNTVITLNFQNDSKNKIFFSVYGLLLNIDGQDYYPGGFGDASLGFFGKGFEPGSNESIDLVFENLPNSKEKKLKIFNISDTRHFIWDAIISIK